MEVSGEPEQPQTTIDSRVHYEETNRSKLSLLCIVLGLRDRNDNIVEGSDFELQPYSVLAQLASLRHTVCPTLTLLYEEAERRCTLLHIPPSRLPNRRGNRRLVIEWLRQHPITDHLDYFVGEIQRYKRAVEDQIAEHDAEFRDAQRPRPTFLSGDLQRAARPHFGDVVQPGGRGEPETGQARNRRGTNAVSGQRQVEPPVRSGDVAHAAGRTDNVPSRVPSSSETTSSQQVAVAIPGNPGAGPGSRSHYEASNRRKDVLMCIVLGMRWPQSMELIPLCDYRLHPYTDINDATIRFRPRRHQLVDEMVRRAALQQCDLPNRHGALTVNEIIHWLLDHPIRDDVRFFCHQLGIWLTDLRNRQIINQVVDLPPPVQEYLASSMFLEDCVNSVRRDTEIFINKSDRCSMNRTDGLMLLKTRLDDIRATKRRRCELAAEIGLGLDGPG